MYMISCFQPSLSNWRIVFLIGSSVSFLGNVAFLVFAAGRRQPWDPENGWCGDFTYKLRDSIYVSM